MKINSENLGWDGPGQALLVPIASLFRRLRALRKDQYFMSARYVDQKPNAA